MNSTKDDPRAKQLLTGKKKFNIDPEKVCTMASTPCYFTGKTRTVHSSCITLAPL